METLEALIARRKITMRAKQVSDNPHMEMKAGMTHWRCSFRNDAGARMTVIFSMGSAHNGHAPNAAEVLDCMASDAASIENARDFADWCSEFGYDSDSRKAEKTYKACQRECDKLKRLMGADYQTLLFNIERP